MTALPLKTAISDTYPNPSNAIARAGFAQLWDAVNEAFEKPEIDVASAATCDIGAQLSTKLRITGTTGITSFGTNYRGPILLRMAGALTITHNATTLRCPGSANISTAAGDVLMAWPTASVSGALDGWQVTRLARGDGILPLAEGGTGSGSASGARTALGLAYGPSFSAYAASTQSISSGVDTKVTLGTEELDTASCFASSRFTPNVAGYYWITGAARVSGTSMTSFAVYVFKNGTAYKTGQIDAFAAYTGAKKGYVSALVHLNGSTDYVELYASVTGTSPSFDYTSSSNASYFSGFLARPA